MKFIYETDRLILKLLGEDDAPAVLQFYRQNRNVFEPYETIHPEQFYTVAYQRTLMNCELSLTLKHSLIRFYIFRRENPDEIIGTSASAISTVLLTIPVRPAIAFPPHTGTEDTPAKPLLLVFSLCLKNFICTG